MCISRQECRCNIHSNWAAEKDFKVYDIKCGKKFKKAVLCYIMIQNNYLDKNSNYLCTACAKHAENLMPSPQQKHKTSAEVSDKEHENFDNQCSSQDIPKSNGEQLVDRLIDFLANSDCSGVPYTNWVTLISLIANKIVNKKICSDSSNSIALSYKDAKALQQLNFSDYLASWDKCVVAFLEGSFGSAFEKERDPQVKYSACVVVEAIYFLRNLNVILPYAFLSNLIQSLVSGSKTVTRINRKVIPSGRYPTIQTWLEEQGKEPLETPSGDIISFFDNIGKYVIKNYCVWSKKCKTADIISTVLHIVLNTENILQSNKDLKSINWCKSLSELEIQQKM